MKFHTTDVLILLLALVGVVTVAVLEFKYASGKTVLSFMYLMTERKLMYFCLTK